MEPSPKLTIELVPQTAWYTNVRSNVSKSEWNRLRKKVYAQAGHRCEICSGKGDKWPVECHEIWEYDDDYHVQRLDRLIALCPACHKVKHMGRTEVVCSSDEVKQIREHLANVNGWTYEEAMGYINKCFFIWKLRSQYQWKLDIDALKQYDEDNETW